MKKISLLLLLLTGCMNSFQSINPNEESPSKNVMPKDKIENKNCMGVQKVQVLQVIEDGYALATECKNSSCYGMAVLLTPQRNIDYYDDMIVTLPEDKCFIQNGVYKYEAKSGNSKTVPVLQYGYKYDATDEYEMVERLKESEEEVNFICKNSLSYEEKNIDENLKKCDCISENFIGIIFSLNEDDTTNKTNFNNLLKDKLTQKCGELSFQK